MYFLPVFFFSQNNSTTAYIRIYLNERGLDKENASNSISVLVTQRSRGSQRELPGLQREPRGIHSSGQTSGVRGWPHGKQQQSSWLLLWRQVLVCATPQCLNKWQCSKPCVAWKTTSVFSMGSVLCVFT